MGQNQSKEINKSVDMEKSLRESSKMTRQQRRNQALLKGKRTSVEYRKRNPRISRNMSRSLCILTFKNQLKRSKHGV